MRPAGICMSYDVMTYISRSTEFRLWPFSLVNCFVICRFLSSTDGSKLIFYLKLHLCETSRVCFHAVCKSTKVRASGGARVH